MRSVAAGSLLLYSGLVVEYLEFGGDSNRVTSEVPAIDASTTIAQTEPKVRVIAEDGATSTDGVRWKLEPPVNTGAVADLRSKDKMVFLWRDAVLSRSYPDASSKPEPRAAC
jgi:hypothetical protein